MTLDEADWIELAFPDEPEWSTVPDQALVDLVLPFDQSPQAARQATPMHARAR